MFEGLKCLECAETDSMSLRFHDNVLMCSECEAETTIEEAQAIILEWQIVLNWAKTAPMLPTVSEDE